MASVVEGLSFHISKTYRVEKSASATGIIEWDGVLFVLENKTVALFLWDFLEVILLKSLIKRNRWWKEVRWTVYRVFKNTEGWGCWKIMPISCAMFPIHNTIFWVINQLWWLLCQKNSFYWIGILTWRYDLPEVFNCTGSEASNMHHILDDRGPIKLIEWIVDFYTSL